MIGTLITQEALRRTLQPDLSRDSLADCIWRYADVVAKLLAMPVMGGGSWIRFHGTGLDVVQKVLEIRSAARTDSRPCRDVFYFNGAGETRLAAELLNGRAITHEAEDDFSYSAIIASGATAEEMVAMSDSLLIYGSRKSSLAHPFMIVECTETDLARLVSHTPLRCRFYEIKTLRPYDHGMRRRGVYLLTTMARKS